MSFLLAVGVMLPLCLTGCRKHENFTLSSIFGQKNFTLSSNFEQKNFTLSSTSALI